MKRIGIIGGVSWQSTLEYYRIINAEINTRCGGVCSAKVIVNSLDFSEVANFQKQGDWQGLQNLIVQEAQFLAAAAADFFLIASNTLHKSQVSICEQAGVNFLSITDVVARAIKQAGIDAVGLLGTKYTMTDGFYHQALESYGIKTLVPDQEILEKVHQSIFSELIFHKLEQKTRQLYVEAIKNLQSKGAQGIILGCTEIPLIVDENQHDVPIFNTTKLHACAAVQKALC